MSDLEKLMKKSGGEAFEDSVEAGINKVSNLGSNIYETARSKPKLTLIAAGATLALGATIIWGVPYAINQYHRISAQDGIEAAETTLVKLIQTQETARTNLDAQRFIIVDSKEGEFDKRLVVLSRNVKKWDQEIKNAKLKFEKGEYRKVRTVLESDEDEGRTGLIDTIKKAYSPIQGISAYAINLRGRRDTALQQEARLKAEFKPRAVSAPSPLKNALGARWVQHQGVLDKILKIAKRPRVKSKGNRFHRTAQRYFISATSTFKSPQFTHYTVTLDNTMTPQDYDNVLGQQSVVFGKIQGGDQELSGMVSYLGRLEEQWFTVVKKRWRDSHREYYKVWIDNPSYRRWSEQACRQQCRPTYSSRQRCRSMATSKGGTRRECVSYRVKTGQSCRNVCRTVWKTNGQPRQIQEQRYRIIPEFWVGKAKHTLGGVSHSKKDVRERYVFKETENRLGFQVWKPYGDDQEYRGFGKIGPAEYKEIPHLVRR